MLPEAASPMSHFLTIRTYPQPVNDLFFFQALKKITEKSVTVTVVRDRKNRTALRTNQIVRFVIVPAWKKNNLFYFPAGGSLKPLGCNRD